MRTKVGDFRHVNNNAIADTIYLFSDFRSSAAVSMKLQRITLLTPSRPRSLTMTAALPVDIWSHILSYCIELPPTPGAHVPQPTLANALRVSSVSNSFKLVAIEYQINKLFQTLFLAAAPHLYSRPTVSDLGSFLLGLDRPTSVFPSSFITSQQMDYEYLKWGHKKIPLLRHLQQVTFYRPFISGYDSVVSPESTVSEATFTSVGYANQVLSHLHFTKTTRISPKFKVLSILDPPELPMYPQTVPLFAQFIQLFIRYFQPRSVCFQNADILISSQTVKLHDPYLPENVIIHADLDWKLTVVWGTTNRVCFFKSKIEEEDNLDLGALTIADPIEGSSQAMEADVDVRVNDEGGWGDIDETSGPPSGLASQRTESTPSNTALHNQSNELYLGTFDPEDLEDDYYDEYGWDDELDAVDDFGGIYDDGVGLPSHMSDFDGDDDVAAFFSAGFSEEEVTSMLADCLSRSFKHCRLNNRKGGRKSIQRTVFEFYGLEQFLSVDTPVYGNPDIYGQDTEDQILQEGIERVREMVQQHVERMLAGVGQLPVIKFLRANEAPDCEGCGRKMTGWLSD